MSSPQSAPRPTSTPVRPMRRTAFILVVLCVLVVFADLAFTFIFGLGNPVLIAPDGPCAYIVKPNQNDYRFFCHIRINQFGMRSAPFATLPAPGALRILFVGDSVTYGTTRVDQSKIFTQILRRNLPSVVHRPVEVLNASADAWAIDNELSYIRSRGIFHSALVVLVLNDADVTQARATLADVGSELWLKRPSSALGELWTHFRAKLLRRAPRTDAGDSVTSGAATTTHQNLADLDAFKVSSQLPGQG